jgi:phenylacetate-CoA ligase
MARGSDILKKLDFRKKKNWISEFSSFDTGAFERLLRDKDAAFWLREGEKRALQVFHEAARRVPAYKDFLRKRKINPASIRTIKDFARVPTTDKRNYINAYSLKDRSWDGVVGAKLAAVSSGTTGEPTFWPRGSYQEFEAAIIHELIYRYSFDIDKHRTLLIIGFPMGVYVSGIATFMPSMMVADKLEYNMTVVSAGNNKAEILRAVKNLQSEYEQIVLVGHPFFIKDVVETGARDGIRWAKTKLRFMFCSEGFNEIWRKYVIKSSGHEFGLRTAVSTYGSSELLLMAWETPLSVYMRNLMQKSGEFRKKVISTRWIPSIFQYNPLMRWIESQEGSLVFTSASGLPLIRYDLHDGGEILPFDTAIGALDAVHRGWRSEYAREDRRNFIWQLPFIKLGGRTDQTLVFYAANIYPEHIHLALNHKPFLEKITGKFVMHKHYLKNMDEYFEINIELRQGVQPSKVFERDLQRHITAKLKEINMEYLFITTHNKKDLRPHIALRPYQDEKYFKVGMKPKYIAADSQAKAPVLVR